MSTIHGYPLDHGLDYRLRVPWIRLDLDWQFLMDIHPLGLTEGNAKSVNFRRLLSNFWCNGNCSVQFILISATSRIVWKHIVDIMKYCAV